MEALLGVSQPRVSDARCREPARPPSRTPFGPPERLQGELFVCAIETEGAGGEYLVHVLENGCFVAALRDGQTGRPTENIQGCGGPEPSGG